MLIDVASESIQAKVVVADSLQFILMMVPAVSGGSLTESSARSLGIRAAPFVLRHSLLFNE